MRGTWQPPLFSDQAWREDMKEKLAESGFVTITCKIIDDKIDSEQTSITLTYNEEILLQKMVRKHSITYMILIYFRKPRNVSTI